MPTLEDAIGLALERHRGQRDKVGQPYVLHLLRAMLRVETEEERIVAVLHDIVEDTPTTFDELRALGYPAPILAAIDAVTRRPDETYAAFIQRAGAHPLGRRVKLADLADNMDLHRLPAVTAKDAERLTRYLQSWRLLRQMERDERAGDERAGDERAGDERAD